MVRGAGEEWPRCGHLTKDAADRPEVDGGGVLARAHEYIGRSVPERDHLGGVGVGGVGVGG